MKGITYRELQRRMLAKQRRAPDIQQSREERDWKKYDAEHPPAIDREYEELRAWLAIMRDVFFDYGEGYDSEMDEMIGSPIAVLQNIDVLLSAFTPEQMKEAKALWLESMNVMRGDKDETLQRQAPGHSLPVLSRRRESHPPEPD